MCIVSLILPEVEVGNLIDYYVWYSGQQIGDLLQVCIVGGGACLEVEILQIILLCGALV